jgi:DNA-binding response OmpR family regulator
MQALKLLVVDDDLDLLEALFDALVFLGHKVNLARNVAEAKLSLAVDTPDVVVCDWNLGDERSTDVFQRARDRWPTAARILMSGSGHEEWRPLLESGLVHIAVAKPFQLIELERAMLTASALCRVH